MFNAVGIAILILLQGANPSTFLERTAEMNRAGIQFAELAMNKAEDERVTRLAGALARRHWHALEMLKASSETDELTQEHQEALDRLSLLSGSEFDREFVDLMVAEHRRAIHLLEQEAGLSRPQHSAGGRRMAPPVAGEMADVALDLLPTFSKLLFEAEKIQDELQAALMR